MAKRLFVGGLPYSVNDSQLEEMFAKFGVVLSATVIVDKYTGRSKGFGFVEMEKDEEADEAIKKLNESEIEGRKITVNVARPREERPSYDNRGSSGGRRDFGGRSDRGRGGRY